MKAAYFNWNEGWNGETRWGRQQRFDYNRAFSMGRQPMQEYKDILDLDGEESVIQLIYEPLPIAIPFLMRMFDRYNQRNEKISCDAVDPFTTKKKKEAKEKAIFNLHNRDKIQALQQNAGAEIEQFDDEDPQSEEEIDVEFGYNYKEREEVLMQELINIVFYENDFDGVIRQRIMDDLCCCGYAGTKTYIDANGRIKIRFIRPENLITSYSEWNDFRTWQYLGEVYLMSIAEIRSKYPGKVSEEKLYELAQNFIGKYGNPTTFDNGWDYTYTTALARPYDGFFVEVVELEMKTLYNLKYKTGEDKYGKETFDRVKYPMDSKNIVQSPAFDVSYTGVMIAETEIVLEWGLSKEMVKPEQNLQEIISSYTVYMYNNQKMVNKPFMETIIPTIKKMQLIDLQQQKIIAAAMPDGYDVDISTMSDVDIGNGQGVLSPFQLYNIKKQTGIGFYKWIDDDPTGERRRQPITPNNVPFSGKLEQLMQQWNKEFDNLLKFTGDNTLASGIITNQAVSQEVVKQARQTGESSSNYLYNSLLNIKLRTAKLVQLRGWDILVYRKKNNRYYDGYRRALGSGKVEYIRIEAEDDFDKTAFDIQMSVVIDDADQIFLEKNLETALAQKEITVADAMEVRDRAKIDSRYASYFLGARINRRRKEQQQAAVQNAQMNTEQQVKAAMAKAKGEEDLDNVKTKNKLIVQEQLHKDAKELEILKSVGILKADVAKSILSQEGKTWKDVPAFVWDGIGIVDQTEQQLLIHALHDQQQQDQQEQQPQDAGQQGQEQQQQPQMAQ